MKHLLVISLVTLLLAACGPKKEAVPITVYEQIDNLYMLADDTSSTFNDIRTNYTYTIKDSTYPIWVTQSGRYAIRMTKKTMLSSPILHTTH